ncbi:hypothetical protein ABK249_02705 [Neorhizobium sp. Rsf11]|uniref:DUF1127 domain-containing protein n=1 Tax=Neorhizobium phenanthreniclasticum TaxID=3157917 RepID=A0ABV0LW65_9HYPH
MTVWEFACARQGWDQAYGSKKETAAAMSDERLAELGIEGF